MTGGSMESTEPKATAPAELAAEALKEPPKKVDEASQPVVGVLDGRTRELLDEMEANCQARLDELRRKNGELAGDRDRWKLRAEKAEAAADPAKLEQLRRERDSAIAQAADLQRSIGELRKTLEESEHDGLRYLRRAQADEHELETTRANLAQAFAARDRVKAERDRAIAMVENGQKAIEEAGKALDEGAAAVRELRAARESLDKLLAEIRKALDPADAKASYWAVWKLLHPNSGVTPATAPKVKP